MPQFDKHSLNERLKESQGMFDFDASCTAWEMVAARSPLPPLERTFQELSQPNPLSGINPFEMTPSYDQGSASEFHLVAILQHLHSGSQQRIDFAFGSLDNRVEELVTSLREQETLAIVEALITLSESSPSRKTRENCAFLAADFLMHLDELDR